MRAPIVAIAVAGLLLGGTAGEVAASAPTTQPPAPSQTPPAGSVGDMARMHQQMLRDYPQMGSLHERMLTEHPEMRGMHERMMGGS